MIKVLMNLIFSSGMLNILFKQSYPCKMLKRAKLQSDLTVSFHIIAQIDLTEPSSAQQL